MTENSKTRVGVIFGGSSVEHEVSVITGIQALNALSDTVYEAVPIYVDKRGSWYSGQALAELDRYRDTKALLRAATPVHPVSGSSSSLLLLGRKKSLFSRRYRLEIDIVLLAMHGSEGENGSLQGMLETLNVPYTGSDVTASAVGMDKALTKSLCATEGIPIVDSLIIREHRWRDQEDSQLRRCKEKLGFPMIVKPCRLGSSVGIHKVDDTDALESAIEECLRLDEKVLVETCVSSLREFNCSVLGDARNVQVSLIEEPVRLAGEALLTYQQKYQRGGKGSGAKSGATDQGMASLDRIIPAEISEDLAAQIRRHASHVFTALGCSGVARIDFLFDTTSEKVYFNEINTIPGSFSFYLWQPAGVPFDKLLTTLLELGFDRHRRNLGKIRSYDTDLLSQSALRGVKGKAG